MTGVSKITDKILAEARDDAAATLAAAKTRAEEISRAALVRAAELRAKVDESARREAAEIVSRAKSSEAMIRRNTVLKAQSDMIDEIFAAAKNELCSLPDEEYLVLMTSLVQTVLGQLVEDEKTNRELYGEEDPDADSPYEIFLNARDRDRCGKALLSAAQRVTERAILSEQTVAMGGGLCLRHGRMEMNCSLETLVEQVRPGLEAKINHTLFPKQSESDKIDRKGN